MVISRKIQDGQIATIGGLNFQGQLILKENSLTLNCTEYSQGGIYSILLNDDILQKNINRYIIFRKITDLFEQLCNNKRMKIKEGRLVLQFEVIYREKIFMITIEIPLEISKFQSEVLHIKKLYEQIARISSLKTNLLTKVEQKQFEGQNLIHFQGDTTNSKYSSFQITNYGSTIKMLTDATDIIFNHSECVPKKGICQFKVRIIKSKQKYIYLGICSADIKSNIGDAALKSPFYIGLSLNGSIYSNKICVKAVQNIPIVQGTSIIKVIINMNKKCLQWYLDDKFLCVQKIGADLLGKEIYPMVTLYTLGDTIQLVNE